jgi:menaquinone-dependent protoporphyrinogen oxidase
VQILISYASTEGHTHKVAEKIAALAQDLHHSVFLYDTNSVVDIPEVEAYDAVVLAGSVHEHEHQEAIVNFATAHSKQLQEKPSALVSVSLSAATPGGMGEAQLYVDRFASETGWTPAKTFLAGGALNLGDCDYFQRQVLAGLLAKCPAITDDDKTYVFTDWAGLEAFIKEFLGAAGAGR